MTHALRQVHVDAPVVVPVPLHAQRKRWRGFDQAALLAHAVAQHTLYAYSDALERTRNTAQQVKAPSRAHRLTAMQQAFRVVRPKSIEQRDVILIDDVCTTGATLGACAVALREAGATSVTALVYARK